MSDKITPLKRTPPPWTLVTGDGSASGYRGRYEISAALAAEHEGNAALIRNAPAVLRELKICRTYLADWIEGKQSQPLFSEEILECAIQDLAKVDRVISIAEGGVE